MFGLGYIKLGIIVAVIVAVLGLAGYITWLRSTVEGLREDLVVSEQAQVGLRLSLEQATEDRGRIEQALATARTEAARALQKAAETRARVVTTVIPSDCPGAVKWLADEVGK